MINAVTSIVIWLSGPCPKAKVAMTMLFQYFESLEVFSGHRLDLVGVEEHSVMIVRSMKERLVPVSRHMVRSPIWPLEAGSTPCWSIA